MIAPSRHQAGESDGMRRCQRAVNDTAIFIRRGFAVSHAAGSRLFGGPRDCCPSVATFNLNVVDTIQQWRDTHVAEAGIGVMSDEQKRAVWNIHFPFLGGQVPSRRLWLSFRPNFEAIAATLLGRSLHAHFENIANAEIKPPVER